MFDYLSRKDAAIDQNQDGVVSLEELGRFCRDMPVCIAYAQEVEAVFRTGRPRIAQLAESTHTDALRQLSADPDIPTYLRNAAASHVYNSQEINIRAAGTPEASVTAWLADGGNPNASTYQIHPSLIAVIHQAWEHRVITRSAVSIVGALQLLLDGGAQINLANELGETPLIASALAEDVDAMRLLLARGANVQHRTHFGWNAYDIAKFKGFTAGTALLDASSISKSGPQDAHLPWYLKYKPFPFEFASTSKKLSQVNEYLMRATDSGGNIFYEYLDAPEEEMQYFMQLTNRGYVLEGSALFTLFRSERGALLVDASYGQYMRDTVSGQVMAEVPADAGDLDSFGRPIPSMHVRDAFRANLAILYGELPDSAVAQALVQSPSASRIYRISKGQYGRLKAYLSGHFKSVVPVENAAQLGSMTSDFDQAAKAVVDIIGHAYVSGAGMQSTPFHEYVAHLFSAAGDAQHAASYWPRGSVAFLQSTKSLSAEDFDLRATSRDRIEGEKIIYTPRAVRLSNASVLRPSSYQGDIAEQMPDGKGTLYLERQEKIVGNFKRGRPHGPYVRFDGEQPVETGVYIEGKREGLVTTYFGSAFISGIRGQQTFADDRPADGPFISHSVNYRTGLLTRSFVGNVVNGQTLGEFKDAVNVRVHYHRTIDLYEDLFGTETPSWEQQQHHGEILEVLSRSGIRATDQQDGSGPFYIRKDVDVSVAALQQILLPQTNKYADQLSAVLRGYQEDYRATIVTAGSTGYVVLDGQYVRYSDYDAERDRFVGPAVVMFLNGDSLEGVLNADGTRLQGRVAYRYASNGSKLTGTIDSTGYIAGPASYTYLDPTIDNQERTVDVHVVNGEFTYRNKAQQDLLENRRKLSKAWKQIFNDGNILTKMEAGIRLYYRDLWSYSLNFIAVKAGLNKFAVTWSSEDGVGIIFSRKGLGEYQLTEGAVNSVFVDLSSKSVVRAGVQVTFNNLSMSINESDKFSYAAERRYSSVRTGKPGEPDEEFRQAKLLPVVGKKGTYFRDLSTLSPAEANEYLLDLRLENAFAWTPEQKAAIATSLNQRTFTDKDASDLSKQLGSELISNRLERFYVMGPVQSFLMTECISWTIDRAKNGLKPEYKVRLYALIALARYSFDKSVWGTLRDRTKASTLSERQKFVIYESMQALEEFDRLIQQGQVDRNQFQVPVIPGLY